MYRSTPKLRNGFTLVELAIVLIIIGLLIGGTLKGQELIKSAKVSATISQIRAMEAGSITFFDVYGKWPGDLADAAEKLPGCSGYCAPVNTNADPNGPGGMTVPTTLGSGKVDSVPGAAMAGGQENVAFFAQMYMADLMDGLDGSNAGSLAIGKTVVGAKMGGGAYFREGYAATTSDLDGVGTSSIRPGHYVMIVGGNAPFDTNFGDTVNNLGLLGTELEDRGFPPSFAKRIDTKYDDGLPRTGNFLGANLLGDTFNSGCMTGAAGSFPNNENDYNTQDVELDCGLYIRVSP